MKTCPGGARMYETQACPPQPKRCLDGRMVPAGTPCMKTCPGGVQVYETEACPPPQRCPDGSVVLAGQRCPPTKRCADGHYVAVSAVCTKTCPGNVSVPETQACPPGPGRCPDGSIAPAGRPCPPTKHCLDGRYVPIGAPCTKRCPDGSTVPETAACAQQCPPGMEGSWPNCSCPRGTRLDPRTRRCLRIGTY
jgi:hypothetical protein